METYIAIAVILLVVGLAAWYVVKAKKSGKKCIGCPNGCCSSSENNHDLCGGSCACCNGCSVQDKGSQNP